MSTKKLYEVKIKTQSFKPRHGKGTYCKVSVKRLSDKASIIRHAGNHAEAKKMEKEMVSYLGIEEPTPAGDLSEDEDTE